MAFTIENDGECAMEYEKVHFGSLNEVITVGDLECFGQVMEYLDQGMARGKHRTSRTTTQHKGRSC